MCDFPWVFCKKLDFVTFPVFLFTWSLNVFFIFFCMAAIADYAAFAAIVDETTWSGLLEVSWIPVV